ncbi:hypothetical protein MW887_000023 [Aspergillus wentii]|nr:hypothetical protein MW887_000023 [Aspergillus wentii]
MHRFFRVFQPQFEAQSRYHSPSQPQSTTMAPEAGTSSSYYLITGIPVKNEPKVGPYKKVGVRIHGQPNVTWDETAADMKGESIKGKSYCTHNTILFPAWHRPYLALYEQRLYEIMRDEIIPGFPKDQQAEWREAADSWRFPFWDWSIANPNSSTGTVKVPQLSKYPTIMVPKSDLSGEERIENPLFQFKVPTNEPMSKKCIGTSRWPDDEDAGINKIRAPNGQNETIRADTEAWRHCVVNNSEVERALSAPVWNFDNAEDSAKFGKPAEAVYRLLTVPMEYTSFATTGETESKTTDQVETNLNIEFIHNDIHRWVGGDNYGHMAQIPVASFDPLFWLHHCNIDRIFALWQALNPDKWFTKGRVNQFDAQDIIGLPVGTEISPTTPLRPFRKDATGAYLNANDVRWTYDLGYTYPELQTWLAKYNVGNNFSQEAFIKDVRQQINSLYGESRDLLLGANGELPGTELVDGGIKSVDYAFSIRYRKYAFGGDPFWIKLYLSQDETPNTKTDPVIAEVFNFSQRPTVNGKDNCENCKKDQTNNPWATAYISVTPVLIKLLKQGKKLESLKKSDVMKYLLDSAYWRVIRHGKIAPSYDVKKVDPQIIGSTNDATNFDDPTKAPAYKNFKPEPSISGGADGALNPAHKQPVTQPPVPIPEILKGNLSIGQTLAFKNEVVADSVVLIDSSKVDLNKIKTDTVDNTQFYFSDADQNIVFLMSVRRAEGEIIFNTLLNNQWGKEERVSLNNRFRSAKPTILVHDQGDGYEIFIDWIHVTWFQKRAKDKKAKTITYSVNKGQNPVWSKDLTVKVYSSMRELFYH